MHIKTILAEKLLDELNLENTWMLLDTIGKTCVEWDRFSQNFNEQLDFL